MMHASVQIPNRMDRGSAIIVAMILVIILAGTSLAMLGMSVSHSNDALTTQENVRAFMAAEAGINEAIAELNRGGDGNITGTLNGVTFDARTIQVDDRYLVDSVGSSQSWQRAVRTVVVPGLPFPVDRAAIMIVGPTGENASLDTVTGNNNNIQISGTEGNVPAVGIQDSVSYTTVMEDIIPKLASGDIDANTFKGSPDVTYTAADGSVGTVPISPMPTPEWDSEKLDLLRTHVLEKAAALIPTATQTFGAGATTFDSPTGFSGVTVINGADLTSNSNVNGSGTLIINGGSLIVNEHNQFHWEGTVIVIGQPGAGASLVNNGGNVNIHGNLIVLGNEGAEAKVEIGPGGVHSNTMIQGATILMAGSETNERAAFEVGSGGINMHGFVGIFGGQAQLHATNDQGVYNVLGSVTVGVDEALAQDGLAEIALDGNVHIHYNENHLQRALEGLLGFVDQMQLPPPTYRAQGWMEISPLLAYQPNAAALAYAASTTDTGSGSSSGGGSSSSGGGSSSSGGGSSSSGGGAGTGSSGSSSSGTGGSGSVSIGGGSSSSGGGKGKGSGS